MNAAFETARDAFATIPGVKSCKIGLEANLSPEDYPMIRIVPFRITPGRPYGNRSSETFVYFGVPVANSEGLESVYESLFDLEAKILEKLKTLQGRYIETLTDEALIDTYKVMRIRCFLEG